MLTLCSQVSNRTAKLFFLHLLISLLSLALHFLHTFSESSQSLLWATACTLLMFPIPHQIHLMFHNPRAELGMSSSSPWGELMNNLGKSPWCYLIWEAPYIMVTARSCDTKGPAVYCVPETPAFINSYKVIHLLCTDHFLYLIYLFLSVMPYSLHLFQFSVQSLCFQMELLDNTLSAPQRLDFSTARMSL